MANVRAGVPAGWQWRDGRPRWIPSPSLRRAGWKGRDLKDTQGQWLARGASIDAAEAVAKAVAAWRAGQLVPVDLAASAPAGAVQRPGAGLPSALADRRTIGALLDAYTGDPKQGLKPSNEFAGLKRKTQEDRRSKLSRFVDVLAGYAIKPGPEAKPKAVEAYQAARAKVRAFSIDALEPPSFAAVTTPEEARGPLYDVYWTLHREVGKHMAHGALANVSAWLEWCRITRAIPANWALLVNRKEPPGRIRVGTWEELRALITAAETLGMPSIADSIILGVDLSWSQADRLALKWPQIGADNTVATTRIKTGRKGATPLLKTMGVPRLKVIRERQAQMFGDKVTPTHVLVCEVPGKPYGKPWNADLYRHKFAEVRELAAQKCPSVADLRDQDLRDTAITVAYAAELSPVQIASRTLHSLKRIQDVLDKHYGEIGQEIADAGAEKLNAYLGEKGLKL